MTPSSSSFWIRRQHGVVDSPTFLATSATASVESSCKRRRIFRSRRSMTCSSRISCHNVGKFVPRQENPSLNDTKPRSLHLSFHACAHRYFTAEHRQQIAFEPRVLLQ